MLTVTVHQQLHGYARGHERLTGSIRLEGPDAALVDRLSDLSGIIGDDGDFVPYLTGYPLPSGKFHALARTWLDRRASRPGCVKTHTLLIGAKEFGEMGSPESLARLFREPDDNLDLSAYGVSVQCEDSMSPMPMVTDIPTFQVKDFVVKYFGRGRRPVVWFDQPAAEAFILRVLKFVWPQLRQRFAFCTLSLDVRVLGDGPFDVLFAPSRARRKFHNISPNQIVGRGPTAPAPEDDSERWYMEWAQAIVRGDRLALGPRSEISGLWDALDGTPTALARIYRLQELREYREEVPSSAVGILDLLAASLSAPNAAVRYKEQVAAEALSSVAASSDTREMLTAMELISERLTRRPFAAIARRVAQQLRALVAEQTVRYPDVVMSVAEAAYATESGRRSPAFIEGLTGGLTEVARSQASRLASLENFDHVVPVVIARAPEIAVAYVESGRRLGRLVQVGHYVRTWIERCANRDVRHRLRELLLQEAARRSEGELIRQLLEGVEREEVEKELSVLWQVSEGFGSREIREAVEALAPLYPDAVRQWAASRVERTFGLAAVIAATYEPDVRGLAELLAGAPADNADGRVIAAYIRRLSHREIPEWAVKSVSHHPTALKAILVPSVANDAEAAPVVLALLEAMTDDRVARDTELSRDSDRWLRDAYNRDLADEFFGKVVSADITGGIPSEAEQLWRSNYSYGEWVGTHVSRIVKLARQLAKGDLERWLNAWRWLHHVPDRVYGRCPEALREVIEALLDIRGPRWPREATELWAGVIERAGQLASPTEHLRLAATALHFAFGHHQIPLSRLVVLSFEPVYKVVTEGGRSAYIADFMFDFFEWDKGKELRRRLVTAFMRSEWPPEGLALAVGDEQLLRKIIKRIRREHGGEQFIERLAQRLTSSDDPRAEKASSALAQLLASPDFEEPWM